VAVAQQRLRRLAGVAAELLGRRPGRVGGGAAVAEAVDGGHQRAALVGHPDREVAGALLARQRLARLPALEDGGPREPATHARPARRPGTI
jgi:hypothetical protein